MCTPLLLSAGKKNKQQRTPLGIGFEAVWPNQAPDLGDPPLPEGHEAAVPLSQHAAAAAAGAVGGQVAAAQWPAAVDPMAAGYVQDASAWQQHPVVQQAPRAPKALSKKQQQKIKEEQKRQAKLAAKKPKKRRRGDDSFSEEESLSVSVMHIPCCSSQQQAPQCWHVPVCIWGCAAAQLPHRMD